jgi:hypothetical protein
MVIKPRQLAVRPAQGCRVTTGNVGPLGAGVPQFSDRGGPVAMSVDPQPVFCRSGWAAKQGGPRTS